MTKGRKPGQVQRRYTKNLSRTTSIRIEEDLRAEAEKAAQSIGLTFAQFVRQSLRRNIAAWQKIEDQIIKSGEY